MKRLPTLLVALILGVEPAAASGGTELRDLLVPGVSYDAAIPTPESALGLQVGEWHVTPDQLYAYLERLDALWDRIGFRASRRA